MNRRRSAILAGLLLAAVLLAGCGDKFTRQRFETVYRNQPDFEVRSTLGRPDRIEADTWIYLHEKPYYKAVITFKDGGVTDKAWSNERPPSGTQGD